MRKVKLAFCILAISGVVACNKSASDTQVSLTPSTTSAKVGETVSVSLTTAANASSWTVSPSSNVTKTYGITTSKVNYFTFNQAGTYTVSVRVRNISYDAALNQSLDSSWNHSGANRGGCTQGVDTASVTISVAGK